MLNEIKKIHELVCDNFDLGSSFTLIITIQGDKAVITNSNDGMWGEEHYTKDIGKIIAETIMLRGLSASGVNYGSFTSNKSLPQFDQILQFTDEDFEFDTEMAKIWTLARVICNSKRDNKTIYEINYCYEADIVCFDTYSEQAYKDYYNETKQYYQE